MSNISSMSAGTWHGVGNERNIHDFLFPKDRNGDTFLVSGKIDTDTKKLWPTTISVDISIKGTASVFNDISKVQFALKLIDNFNIKEITQAMLDYVDNYLPERKI